MKLQRTALAGILLTPECDADARALATHGIGQAPLQGAAPILEGGRPVGLVLCPMSVIGPVAEHPKTEFVMLSHESQPLAFNAADPRLQQQPSSRVLWFPTACGSQQPQPERVAAFQG